MQTPPFTHAGGIVVRRTTGTEPLVLVVRPTKPGATEWVLPKGHIEPGETTEEAALREVAEEAQVAATNPRFVGSTSYKVPHEDVVCAFYLMDEFGPAAGGEDRETAWLSEEELRQQMPYPESIDLMERALRMS